MNGGNDGCLLWLGEAEGKSRGAPLFLARVRMRAGLWCGSACRTWRQQRGVCREALSDTDAYSAMTTVPCPAAAASPASSSASAASVLKTWSPGRPRALAGAVLATAAAGPLLAALALLTARMQDCALAALTGFKGMCAAIDARRRPARQHQGERTIRSCQLRWLL